MEEHKLQEEGAGGSHQTDVRVVDEALGDLVNAIGTGNIALIDTALDRLGVRREHELYNRVGHLARSLHDSLREFKSSLEKTNLTMTSTNLPDAADKLEAVMRMTQEAAEHTMNLVDEQSLKISQERARVREFSEFLQQPGVSADAIKEACSRYFEGYDARLVELDRINGDIIVAQNYQDLTGQALQKVVKLVTGIETQLLSLIQLFGGESALPGPSPEATPAPEPPSPEEGRLSQDATDALLASFGF